MPTAPVIALLTMLLASCANYDFAKARAPDGTPDMKKMIADLAASGETSLNDGLWIPLLYCNITTFQRSPFDMATGYTFDELRAVGPIFCCGTKDTTLVDEKGEQIEQSDRWWLGWGLLLHDYDEYVETAHGVRCHGRFRWLAVLGQDSTHYVRRTVRDEQLRDEPSR